MSYIEKDIYRIAAPAAPVLPAPLNICIRRQIEYSCKSPVTTLQKLSYVWEPFISILCCLKTVSSPSVDDSKIILILLIATWLQNL